MKNSIKEMKKELASTGNRADQRGERISDVKDRDLEVMQMDRERDLRVPKKKKRKKERKKKMKELYQNF